MLGWNVSHCLVYKSSFRFLWLLWYVIDQVTGFKIFFNKPSLTFASIFKSFHSPPTVWSSNPSKFKHVYYNWWSNLTKNHIVKTVHAHAKLIHYKYEKQWLQQTNTNLIIVAWITLQKFQIYIWPIRLIPIIYYVSIFIIT